MEQWLAGIDPSSAVTLLEKGGPVVAVIAVMSIVAVAVGLVKAVQFAVVGVGRPGAVRGAVSRWTAGDHRGAMRRLARLRQPSAAATLRAMERLASAAEPAVAREDAYQVAEGKLDELRQHLRVLEATAQVAPLLGLFGTVLGMMGAFQTLEAAAGEADPAALAGGIWVALITTAAGLAVAMPAGLALYWFEGRIERETVLAETSLAQVFTAPPDGPGAGRSVSNADPLDMPGGLHAAE